MQRREIAKFLQFSGPIDGIVTLLLTHGADPNCVTQNCPKHLLPPSSGYSGNDTLFPLMSAACGTIDVPVKLLLKAGANVNQTNSLGQTALHVLCQLAEHSNNILRTLLSHSSDVNLRDALGRTPIHYACQRSTLEAVNHLLEAGAMVNIVDSRGFTELEVAAQSRIQSDLKVKRLMESSAYPNEMIIEVYETMAFSWYIWREHSTCRLDKAIDCLRKATIMRKEHDVPKIVSEPLECYGFTKEWETLEDLELHLNSQEELEMQAMIARERIYKGRHTTQLLFDNFEFQRKYIKTYCMYHIKLLVILHMYPWKRLIYLLGICLPYKLVK